MAQMALIIQLITVWDQRRHVGIVKRRRSHHLMLVIEAAEMASKAALDVLVSLLVGEARGHGGAVELWYLHDLAERFGRERWLVVEV